MTATLLRKEWSQHWHRLLLLGVSIPLVILLFSFFINANGTGAGTFSGVGYGMIYIIPLAGLILSNRFVNTEFQEKTQLFLEGLPLRRWKMISVKLFLCYLFILLYSTGSILLGWLLSFGTEIATPRFLGIMMASAGAWSLFVMGFFFVIGFLGRYRIVILLLVIVSLASVANITSFPLTAFPPFELVDPSRFGLEKETFPLKALQVTLLYSLGWTIVAFFLGLAREGSVASMLGEKMSYREKMFVGGTVGIVIYFVMLFTGSPKPVPFSTPGAVNESWDGVEVFVSPEERKKPVDLEIAIGSKLARRLAAERDWLGIAPEEFPTIYLIERSDIEEKERIEWEEVYGENLIKMYAGYREPEFSENRLLSWTLSQVLRKHSLTRVGHEDRWWIVCGLEGLWEMKEADEKTIHQRIQMAVDAVDKHGLTFENLMGWSKYQDDVEWRSADAVAWMGMRKLVELKGLEAVQAFAKATVTQSFSRVDSRAVFWDYANPVTPAFEKTTTIPLKDFVEDWKAYILSFKVEENDKEKEEQP